MHLLLPMIALVAVMLASFGANRVWGWMSSTRRGGTVAALALTVMTAATAASPASAQSDTSIEFDMQPFFDSLNDWLPTFISIFAIVGGIIGAMALARYIIGMVVQAFRGGSL